MKHWISGISNWKKYLQVIICFLVLGLKISHHLWHLFGTVLVFSQDRINVLAAAVGGEPGAFGACLGCLSIPPGTAENLLPFREGGTGCGQEKATGVGGPFTIAQCLSMHQVRSASEVFLHVNLPLFVYFCYCCCYCLGLYLIAVSSK